MMQNSLVRLFEGIVSSLRESVLPAVEDPYARSQVLAAIELIGNLGARVEWRSDQVEELFARVDGVLSARGKPRLERSGDVAEDRRRYLVALAELAGQMPLSDEVRELLVWDLDEEMGRIKTGMFRKPEQETR
jgi:hypothetical protein